MPQIDPENGPGPGECPSNSTCSGHRPPCSNSYSFTATNVGTTISSAHINQLRTAIQNERTNSSRRGISPACPSNCNDAYTFSGSITPGSIIYASHFVQVRDANNTTAYSTNMVNPFGVGSPITATLINNLKSAINGTRNNCICNSHCTCDIDCGCNGVCVCDCDCFAAK